MDFKKDKFDGMDEIEKDHRGGLYTNRGSDGVDSEDDIWSDIARNREIGSVNYAAAQDIAENEAFSKDYDAARDANAAQRDAEVARLARTRLKLCDYVLSGGGYLSPYDIPLFQKDIGDKFAGALMSTGPNGKMALRTLVRDSNGKVVPDPSSFSMEDIAALASRFDGILSPQSKAIVTNYINKHYTRRQQLEAGLTRLNPELLHDRTFMYRDRAGGRLVGSVNMGGGAVNSSNAEIGITVDSNFGPTLPRADWIGSDSGARPGPRPRYISMDDINGRPRFDPDDPGSRYRGHGVSSFSTAQYAEDRENAKYPNGRWKQTSIGAASSDPNDRTQIRTYENSKTGEVVRVKDGERAPWQTGYPSEKERIAQMQDEGRTKRLGLKNDNAQEIERIRNEARKLGYELKSSGGQKFDKNQYNAIRSEMESLLGDREYDDLSDDEKKEYDDLKKMARDMAKASFGSEDSSGGNSGGSSVENPAGNEEPNAGESVQGNVNQKPDRDEVRKSIKASIAELKAERAKRASSVQTKEPKAKQPAPVDSTVGSDVSGSKFDENALGPRRSDDGERNQVKTENEEDPILTSGVFERWAKDGAHNAEKDKAWKRWWIEHGSANTTKSEQKKLFEKWWSDMVRRNDLVGKTKGEDPSFIGSGR